MQGIVRSLEVMGAEKNAPTAEPVIKLARYSMILPTAVTGSFHPLSEVSMLFSVFSLSKDYI
jgi:hypothetical protein